MKIFNFTTLSLLILLISACNNTKSESNIESETALFPKGEGRRSDNFNGTTYRVGVMDNAAAFDLTVGSVTFDPGVRTNWHSHTSGQILIVTAGNGYYQEKGKPVRLIKKGDVVEVLSDVVHWHGATPEGEMTHMTIRPKAGQNDAVWMEPVADDDYSSYAK